MDGVLYKRRQGPRDEEITQREWVFEVVMAHPDQPLARLLRLAKDSSVNVRGDVYYTLSRTAPVPFQWRDEKKARLVRIAKQIEEQMAARPDNEAEA